MSPVTLLFNGSPIEASNTVRNLGVTFDSHLKFTDHIGALVKTCTGSLIALNHARHAIPRSVMPCLVQALVISVLRYCMSVYGTCNSTQLHRVQKVLNFCARVVSGRRRRDHVSDVLEGLGWMNANQLVTYHAVCAVQSTLSTRQPDVLRKTIGSPANRRHDHGTRGADRRTLPHIRTESGRRRLCYRGVAACNEMGLDLSGANFRRNLKSMLLSQR